MLIKYKGEPKDIFSIIIIQKKIKGDRGYILAKLEKNQRVVFLNF